MGRSMGSDEEMMYTTHTQGIAVEQVSGEWRGGGGGRGALELDE